MQQQTKRHSKLKWKKFKSPGEKFVIWCEKCESFRADRVVLLVMDFTGLGEIKQRLC